MVTISWSGYPALPAINGMSQKTPNIRFSVLTIENPYGSNPGQREHLLLAEALSFETEVERTWGMIGDNLVAAAKNHLGSAPVSTSPRGIEKDILARFSQYRSGVFEIPDTTASTIIGTFAGLRVIVRLPESWKKVGSQNMENSYKKDTVGLASLAALIASGYNNVCKMLVLTKYATIHTDYQKRFWVAAGRVSYKTREYFKERDDSTYEALAASISPPNTGVWYFLPELLGTKAYTLKDGRQAKENSR